MKQILLAKSLKQWIDYQVEAELAQDNEVRRDQVVLSVLAEFLRHGNAERYLRSDGKLGFRATPRFLESVTESERDAEQYDESP
jgi:hypothetical protein